MNMNQVYIDDRKVQEKDDCEDYDANRISIEDLDKEIKNHALKDVVEQRTTREILCKDLKHSQHLNRLLLQRVQDLEAALHKSDQTLASMQLQEKEECKREDDEIISLIAKVHELEADSKAIEEDFKSVIKEGDDEIQALEKQQHQKPIKHHYAQKNIDTCKNQVQKLRNNLATERKQNAHLKATLDENENVCDRLTKELKEVGVKTKMHEDMRLHAGKEESALAMKCHAVNHLRKRMAEYEDS